MTAAADLAAGVHWFAATTFRPLGDVLAFLSETFGGADFFERPRGVSGYTRTFTTMYGLRVYDNPDCSEMGVHLIADGTASESIGLEAMQLIYHGLEMRPTRIDVAIDHCPFGPADLYSEWLKDNVRTRCKASPVARKGREHVRVHAWMSSPSGDTIYMGSRKSTAFARCYDERGFTRLELELKGSRAAAAAELLFETLDVFGATALGLVRDFVDFVDKDSSANRSRCDLLPYWHDFVGSVSRMRVQIGQRPQPSLDRISDWIWGQVSPSLALYEMYLQAAENKTKEEIRRDLRREGLSRLSARRMALYREAVRQLPGHARPEEDNGDAGIDRSRRSAWRHGQRTRASLQRAAVILNRFVR